MQPIALSTAPAGAHDGILSQRRVPVLGSQEDKTISVHLAECDGLRSQAEILINRMYSWRGYGADHQLASGNHRAIFTACSDGQVIGTLTLTVDTPAGLSTDQTFKSDLDEIRRGSGTTLCELTKFAMDPNTKSPAVLAALFHAIFIYGIQCFGCTDVVIEVHPRHVRYYEAMLGFKRAGAPKFDASVEWWPSDTPVQLMRLNLHDMRELIDCYRGCTSADSRSLYPHFFSREEEFGIAMRVARLSNVESGSGDASATPNRQNRTPSFLRAAA